MIEFRKAKDMALVSRPASDEREVPDYMEVDTARAGEFVRIPSAEFPTRSDESN